MRWIEETACWLLAGFFGSLTLVGLICGLMAVLGRPVPLWGAFAFAVPLGLVVAIGCGKLMRDA